MSKILKKTGLMCLALIMALGAFMPATLAATQHTVEHGYEEILTDALIPEADLGYGFEVIEIGEPTREIREPVEEISTTIEATMTSAIDGNPFTAIFNPATGTMTMYAMDGEFLGYRILENVEAFWELVAINTEVATLGFAEAMHRADRQESFVEPNVTTDAVDVVISPFSAETVASTVYDPEAGRVYMFNSDGELLQYLYVESEEAFLAIAEANAEIAYRQLELFEQYAGIAQIFDADVFSIDTIAPMFNTGIISMTIPQGSAPGVASSVWVGGGTFATNTQTTSISLQTFAFPAGMNSMDVLFTNAIGDDTRSVWDMRANSVESHNVRWRTERYGARVNSWNGTFHNVQVRLSINDGNTTQPIDPPIGGQTVTIVFNINGGNGANTTVTRTSGTQFGTLPNAPTRNGHRFLGWYTTSFSGGERLTPNSTVPAQGRTYWARWAQYRSRTLTHTGSMMIMGWRNTTRDSNIITFNGNTIPQHAVVTSISVNTGTSTMSGAIIGNNLQISSTARTGVLTIPWNGGNNTTLNNTHFFWNHDARATYSIRWNGTVIGNTPGNLFNPGGTEAIRGFSNVRLTINYIVIPPSFVTVP